MTWFAYPYNDDDAKELAADFASAQPFPHLVLQDFIGHSANEVVHQFPGSEWAGWSRFRDEYQIGKMFCEDIEAMPDPFADMIHELSSPRFLRFLETITGIGALIPDPHLNGGGLHCSPEGGVLAPHTDFHIYDRLELFRRINVLVYLNSEWGESDGGCLELWCKGDAAPSKAVVPSYGTCVIFRTDDSSVHGFSPITRTAQPRRSLALYYYTSTESAEFSGDTHTYWQQHGPAFGTQRLRLGLYHALLYVSRRFSRLAYRANPKVQGVPLPPPIQES
ncbi:MAG: 2OG-Fe(II) oxygenase [Actinomycetota bacterium]|nr:2OG-Fe(II) oxygenase [Actinomycetota bacterium]